MSVVVIGLNHRTVPLDLLERMTVTRADLPKAVCDVASRSNVTEAVVLSTCNRLEIYAVAGEVESAHRDVCDFLVDLSSLPVEEFSEYLYFRQGEEALRHLFRVASGIDSAVIGEDAVLAQLRRSWEMARQEGATGSLIDQVFDQAVGVGKRARTETAIGSSARSMASDAVAMARDRLGSLDGTEVLVIGAGEVAEGIVASLVEGPDDIAEVRVANRTLETARRLARRAGGRATDLADLAGALGEVDLLFTSTGAKSLVVEHHHLVGAMASRAGRGLLIVDLAVPRDVAISGAELPGVTLLDMDDLAAFATTTDDQLREMKAVEAIVDEEVRRSADSARELSELWV